MMLPLRAHALCAIGLVLGACNAQEATTDVWKGHPPERLAQAWHARDSATVRAWINSLADPSLSAMDFYNRVEILSEVTGFKFGLADPGEKGAGYWQIPLAERDAHQRNVVRVYRLYAKSRIFMCPVAQEETVLLQERYLNTTTDFDSSQLQYLRNAIERVHPTPD